MRMTCLLLLGFVGGCAASGSPSPTPDTSELNLQGDNTRLRFTIDRNQTITSDEADQILADQEMCYLTINDKVTIECFPFGSLLMMGPDDAEELVDDNPLDDLHADSQDTQGELLLETLSVVGLVGDSVERLPDALADYLDDTSQPNPGVATNLAHHLIDSEKVKLAGMSRAGPFTIMVELTEDGKETLRQALADRESGDLHLVHHLRRHAHSPATKPTRVRAELRELIPSRDRRARGELGIAKCKFQVEERASCPRPHFAICNLQFPPSRPIRLGVTSSGGGDPWPRALR